MKVWRGHIKAMKMHPTMVLDTKNNFGSRSFVEHSS